MSRARAEELLAHSQFLRGLVASVVGRDDLADDVLQEAWLAAVSGPPRAGWDPRRWLSGVVRNLARQLRRERGRRSRRERVAAKPERLPATDETVARLECVRAVVDAVEGLQPLFREVVMLRFFDAMPPREIARRLEVPVETVRTRLRRALEQLRGRLDHVCGDRSEWMACLLPFVHLEPAAKAGVKVACAVAAVALLGVCLAPLGSRPSGTAPSVALPATASGRVAASLPVAGPGSEVRTRVVPAGAQLRIHGRVTRSDSNAYNAARVRIRVSSGFGPAPTPDADVRVDADAGGWFAWECPRPAGPVHVAVDCGVPRRETRAAEDLIWVPGEPDPGALHLRCYLLDGEVVGTVRDAAGDPIAGAVVQLFRAHASTDRHGRYLVRGTSALHGQGMRVFARGAMLAERNVHLQAGQQVRIDWELRSGVRISGRVTAPDGTPVAGATVGDIWATMRREGVTDAEGRYELTHLDPGKPAWITVRHDAHPDTTVTVDHGGRPATCDVVMAASSELRGAVVDADGRPVLAATVQLFEGTEDFNGSARRRVVSKGGGRFVIRGARHVDSTLVVTRRGHGPALLQLNPGKQDGALRIALPAALSITGRVLDEEGRPIAGVSVWCGWGTNPSTAVSLMRAWTGADGRFRLDDVPAGAVVLSAMRRDHLGASVPAAGGDAGVTIRMRRAGGFAGTVVDAETRRPIPKFRVRFVTPDLRSGEQGGAGYSSVWSEPGVTFSGLRGEWSTGVQTLEVGHVFGLEFSAEGYASRVVPRAVAEVDPDPARFVIALDSGQALAGRIVSAATGEPVAGATVEVLTSNDHVRGFRPDVESGRRTTTDAEGKFRFPRVAHGEVRLLVTHAGHAPHLEGPFRERGFRAVRVERGGTVSGAVTGAEDRPIAGAWICLSPIDRAGAAIPRDARADAGGGFRFAHVPAGEYEITWTERRGSSGIVRRTYRVRVTNDREVAVPMGVPRTGQRVHGKVAAAGPLPPHCYVGLIGGTPPPADAAQDVQRMPGWIGMVEDGAFEILGVPAGEYTLYVSRLGDGARVSGIKKFVVHPGQPCAVEVEARVDRR